MYGYWIIPLAVLLVTWLITCLKSKKFNKFPGSGIFLAFISFFLIAYFPLFIKGLEVEEINKDKIELQSLFSNENKVYLSTMPSGEKVKYLYLTKDKNEMKITPNTNSIVKEFKNGDPYLQVKKIQLKSKFSRWMYGDLNNTWNHRSKTRTIDKYEFHVPKNSISQIKSESE